MVRLLLCGSNILMAFGATNVDVSMKKINSRNTKSDIDEELKSALLWFLLFSAMTVYFAGSFKTSINSMLFDSSRLTTLSI